MRDWKTTAGAAGVLAGAVMQNTISPETGNIMVAFFAALIGLFARDGQKRHSSGTGHLFVNPKQMEEGKIQ